MLAARPADRLAGLALGLGGDGAGVDDDRVGQARRRARAADHLALEGVQPAAEGDDLDARHRHELTPIRESSGVEARPRRLSAAGPVMMTWPSSRQSIVELAAVEQHRGAPLGQAAPRSPRPARRRRRCRRRG